MLAQPPREKFLLRKAHRQRVSHEGSHALGTGKEPNEWLVREERVYFETSGR